MRDSVREDLSDVFRHLVDRDNDGRINEAEFCVAMHLIRNKVWHLFRVAIITVEAGRNSDTCDVTSAFRCVYQQPNGFYYVFWS